MLEIADLDVAYGEKPALRGVAMRVGEGECVSVLGANGAGKSTLLRTISGLLKPRRGSVALDGRRLDQLPAYEIAGLGIAHVPEGRRVLPPGHSPCLNQSRCRGAAPRGGFPSEGAFG